MLVIIILKDIWNCIKSFYFRFSLQFTVIVIIAVVTPTNYKLITMCWEDRESNKSKLIYTIKYSSSPKA